MSESVSLLINDGGDCKACLFFWLPLNLAVSQAHYKILYLGNFFLGGGCQFKLYRAWDLVKLGGARKKRHPVYKNHRIDPNPPFWVLLYNFSSVIYIDYM